MTAARNDLEALVAEVFAETQQTYPDRLAGIDLLSAPGFARRLIALRTSDLRKQRRLMQICGFFETVGYVTFAGYITLEDVYSLLGGSILMAATVFLPYIDVLLEQGAHPKLFENFRWLIDRVKRH